jgi:hypothetical protein
MRLVISFCRVNRSAVLLSKCSAHSCVSVAASIHLGVDTNVVPRPKDTAFQHIADAKLAPDLLSVHGLAPLGECSIARDDQHIRDPRQIGR